MLQWIIRSLVLIVVGIIASPGQLFAASPYFTVDYTPTGNDLIWTSFVTYSLKPVPDSSFPYVITGYQWQYKRSCNNTWVNTTGTPNAMTESCYEIFVGTFEVRCRLTLGDASGGPIPPPGPHDVDGTTITIPPPDGVRLVSGSGINTTAGDDCPVFFQITCKEKDCSMAVGHVQERARDVLFVHSGNKIKETDWFPAPGTGTRFVLEGGGRIKDLKGLRPNAAWFALPAGPFQTLKQDIRILLSDPCGTVTPYPLPPPISIEFVKNPDNTYKINHN